MSYVLTAKVGNNAALFADILRIYVPPRSKVLDMTWGRGNFWKDIDVETYRLVTNDIVTEADMHEDFRSMSLPDRSFDCVVLDPPYALHGKGAPIKASISSPYQLNAALTPTSAREVRQVYRAGISEARRLLKPNGILIIKCQDQIESGKQQYIHAYLLKLAGFVSEDLFVLVQTQTPAMRHTYQKHARKNHSYFIVQRRVV